MSSSTFDKVLPTFASSTARHTEGMPRPIARRGDGKEPMPANIIPPPRRSSSSGELPKELLSIRSIDSDSPVTGVPYHALRKSSSPTGLKPSSSCEAAESCLDYAWFGLTAFDKEQQYVVTLINTFLETTFTATTLAGWESLLLGMSGWGMAIGLLVAFCEAKGGRAVSDYFDKQEDAEAGVASEIKPITWTQTLYSGGYFASKLMASTQPALVFVNLLALNTTVLGCAIAYPVIGVWALLVTVRDLQNVVTAFKGGNAEEAEAGKAGENKHEDGFWHKAQSAGNFVNSFLTTTFAGSAVVTGLAGLTQIAEYTEGLSWGGLAAAFPFAVFFSICEAHAHGAESHDIAVGKKSPASTVEKSDIEQGATETVKPQVSLTTAQKICVYGHFLSSVMENAQPGLAIAVPAGLTQTGKGAGWTVAVLGMFGVVGSVRDWVNTKEAYLRDNQRKADEKLSSQQDAGVSIAMAGKR